jgi:hypothetical protein
LFAFARDPGRKLFCDVITTTKRTAIHILRSCKEIFKMLRSACQRLQNGEQKHATRDPGLTALRCVNHD